MPPKKKPKLQCGHCNETFSDKKNLKRHNDQFHNNASNSNLKCLMCNKTLSRQDAIERHMNTHVNLDTALDGSVVVYTYELSDQNKFDPSQALASVKDKFQKDIVKFVEKQGSLKAYVAMQIRFIKATEEGNYSVPFFRSSNFTVLRKEDKVEDNLDTANQKIMESMAKYQREGSNWTLNEVANVQLYIIRYKPLPGSSYIKTPAWLCKKGAIINVKNPNDNECFKWSILSALYNIEKDPQRLSHYKNSSHVLKFDGLNFPIKIDDVKDFERQNEELSVNILDYDKKNNFKPLYMTGKRGVKKHINLLLIKDGDKGHYCWIKNFSRLMGNQKKDNNKHFYCDYCFYHTKDEARLNEHTTYCLVNGNQISKLPKTDKNILSFQSKGLQKRLKSPLVIYADFECILVPGEEQGDKKSHAQKRKTLNIHKPCGFAYKVVGLTEEYSKDVQVYRGEDAVEKFIDSLLKETNWFKNLKEKDLNMTPEDESVFRKSTSCWICSNPFIDNTAKVRDHCHYLGTFRGAAHRKCNINYKKVQFIPVVMHNLSRYDSHLIMQAKNLPGHLRFDCIPQSIDRYISFNIGKLRFIDSILFLNSSLEKLVENLVKDDAKIEQNFKHTFSLFPENPEKVSWLLKKQVYPYEYMDTHDKFKEKELPPIEKFHNILKDEKISEEDYKHAEKVWKVFDIKTLGEYHDLYVQTDVVLLADVFEHFRKTSIENYKLDCAHFYTTPGLAWHAALLKTKVNVELLTDLEMHNMIERGIRGGVAMISQRYSKANNENIPDFDSSKPNSWIIYLDANNLYGWAMSQPLPLKDFRWLSEEKISEVQNRILEGTDTFMLHDSDNEETGYILEVDLEYPKELHDQHNEFPLAPEKINLTPAMLSPYCKDLLEKLNMKGPPGEKLIANLMKKEKYVVHYRTLKLYLKLGMKLTKVHRVMSFHQAAWLKPYIDFNTEQRRKSGDVTQKDFFKLMNNSVFGKTLENVRKYKDVKFVTDKKKRTKLTAKPNFHSFRIFNEKLVAIEMAKKVAKLDKPIQVGSAVLDLAKAFIYEFHYSQIKAKYGEKAKLLFTDTDSLCYEIETQNIYDDFKDNPDLYDFSNYQNDHVLFNDQNKNVVGKMKDETQGIPVERFVGLRPKMYALKYGERVKMAAHGVSKEQAKRKILFENYEDCFNKKDTQHADSVTIESSNHEIRTVKHQRVTLSPYDDKRYIHQDGITSLAYGHYKIPEPNL